MLAYCFDRAVLIFGQALQSELDKVSEKNQKTAESKQKAILSRWIPEAPTAYQDPARNNSNVFL